MLLNVDKAFSTTFRVILPYSIKTVPGINVHIPCTGTVIFSYCFICFSVILEDDKVYISIIFVRGLRSIFLEQCS